MSISYDKANECFELNDWVLYWKLPTKGMRRKGSIAGTVSKSGRCVIEMEGNPYQASSIIWLMTKGEWPKERLFHTNGNGSDNNISNLDYIAPKSVEVDHELLLRIFRYEDGKLYWIDKPTQMSRVKIGAEAGSFDNQKSHIYRRVKIGGIRYKIADLVWFYHHGVMPEKILDHINHVSTDDRIENLREVTPRENARNRRISVHNTSGVIGVDWAGGWQARIQDNDGNRVYLGTFLDIDDAIQARKDAESKYGYHKNHGTG